MDSANSAILQRRREESRYCRRRCREAEDCHGSSLQVRDFVNFFTCFCLFVGVKTLSALENPRNDLRKKKHKRC